MPAGQDMSPAQDGGILTLIFPTLTPWCPLSFTASFPHAIPRYHFGERSRGKERASERETGCFFQEKTLNIRCKHTNQVNGGELELRGNQEKKESRWWSTRYRNQRINFENLHVVDFSLRWAVLLCYNKFKNFSAETVDGPICSKVSEYFPGMLVESPGISVQILVRGCNVGFRGRPLFRTWVHTQEWWSPSKN